MSTHRRRDVGRGEERGDESGRWAGASARPARRRRWWLASAGTARPPIAHDAGATCRVEEREVAQVAPRESAESPLALAQARDHEKRRGDRSVHTSARKYAGKWARASLANVG